MASKVDDFNARDVMVRMLDYCERIAKEYKKQAPRDMDGAVYNGLMIGLLMGITHREESMALIGAMDRIAPMGKIKADLRWTVEYIFHGKEQRGKKGRTGISKS